jgi:mannose-1-phosphate guanylyltransferase
MKAVILCGGSGTRLWPLSRLSKPKQFQALASEKTLFQEAVERLDFLDPEDIFISTNTDFVEVVKEQAPHLPEKNIIIEPALRDTASCIGLAAAVIAKNHPDEVMAVIYADHLIKDQDEFQRKLKATEKIARDEHSLNIIEVKAKFPNVNLGYVKIGDLIKKIEQQSHDPIEVYAFEKFTEKPDLETAKKFLESSKYLWNTGIYVWEVSTILDAYRTHLPDTYERLMRIQAAYETPEQEKVIQADYPECQKISIDYAIMEKVNPSHVRIIPADLGWSDIGTWLSLHEELADKTDDNITHGDTLSIDTTGSVLHNTESGKCVVALGMKDVAIINTPDAILICPKDRSQDVKKAVAALKNEERMDLL